MSVFFLPVEFAPESTLALCEMDKNSVMACQLPFTGDISRVLILLAPRNLIAKTVVLLNSAPLKLSPSPVRLIPWGI